VVERSPSRPQADPWREERTAIVEQNLTKAAATEKIKPWPEPVADSGWSWFKPLLTTLDNWLDEITPDFLNREPSGVGEGMNHQINGLKRRGSGRFNLGHRVQRLVLDLAGYQLFAKTAS